MFFFQSVRYDIVRFYLIAPILNLGESLGDGIARGVETEYAHLHIACLDCRAEGIYKLRQCPYRFSVLFVIGIKKDFTCRSLIYY